MGAIRKVYTGMDKLSGWVQKLLEAVVAILIATCALDLFFQVVYRFIIIKFITISFPFTEEYARYALIWSSYLCVGLCFKNGSMASVNVIYDRLGKKCKLALYVFTRILMAIFLVVGVQYGVQAIVNNQIYTSPVMRIPGIFLYSAPFVGCALMSYEVVTEFLGVLCGKLEPFKGRPEPQAELEDFDDLDDVAL